MVDRPREPKPFDFNAFAGKNLTLSLKTAETRDERASRLKREEAKEDLDRRIALIVHIFIIAVVAVAFLTCVSIALFKDPKTGLPDKAMGIITAIVAAGVGYITGKGSQ